MTKIVVERDRAVGVQPAEGGMIAADWVVSAADGHATVYDLLAGVYADERTGADYRRETVPSYLQVSLGVARDFAQHAGEVLRVLDAPLEVDPETKVSEVGFRFFNYDPTFAPRGKTAITCILPTRNFAFWEQLRERDPARYQAEKNRIAEEIVALLERTEPDIRRAIEVVDVSTPATVIRYTGNWKGSMEGWMLKPGGNWAAFRHTLPGLRRFFMVGQWASTGGGLPMGLMTARSAVRAICRQDRVAFCP